MKKLISFNINIVECKSGMSANQYMETVTF